MVQIAPRITAKIPTKLQPLADEAAKYDTFDDFKTAYVLQIKHGRYYHVTDNPNFTIDPQRGPRDMSSLAGEAVPEKGKLMITSHLDYWAEEYKGTRQYVAIIDMSQVPKEKYWQVNRGFGNEFWVDDPSKAKVIKVVPMKDAKRDARLHQDALDIAITGPEDLRAFFNKVKGVTAMLESSPHLIQVSTVSEKPKGRISMTTEEIQAIASRAAETVLSKVSEEATPEPETGQEEELDEQIENELCGYADKLTESFSLFRKKRFAEGNAILNTLIEEDNCSVCQEVIESVQSVAKEVEAAAGISDVDFREKMPKLYEKVDWAMSAFCPEDDSDLGEDADEIEAEDEAPPPQAAD